MHAAERVALHQLDLLRRHCVDLVLADQRVAPRQRRWGDHATPAGAGRIAGVAPQWVVVSIGDRDMAEGVEIGAQVMRGLRVRLGHADTGPQPGDALVGDGPRSGHIAYYR